MGHRRAGTARPIAGELEEACGKVNMAQPFIGQPNLSADHSRDAGGASLYQRIRTGARLGQLAGAGAAPRLVKQPMEELFEDIEKLASVEERVAMATLVATRGTSPKKEGAKMWVGEEGRILGSVTIGGCVDARVIAESEKALNSFEPRLLSINLEDEDAWEIGFACAGNLKVMVEPLDLADHKNNLLNLYREVRAEVEQGRCAVLATSLEKTSSKLLVLEDGRVSGTLGDAVLDREARTMALDLIQKRASRTVSLPSA